jgi:hypothetical protein
VILAGVAAKLLLADVWEFPTWSAPAFIAAVLAVVALASLRDNRRRPHPGQAQDGGAAEAAATARRSVDALEPAGRDEGRGRRVGY